MPRRGDIMVVVLDEIDIDDDLLRFTILLLLLLFLSNRVRRSVRVRGPAAAITVHRS